MTGIHVLLCFAIVLNMGFVYIAYQLLILLRQYFYRISTTLESIEGSVKHIDIMSTRIEKYLDEL